MVTNGLEKNGQTPVIGDFVNTCIERKRNKCNNWWHKYTSRTSNHFKFQPHSLILSDSTQAVGEAVLRGEMDMDVELIMRPKFGVFSREDYRVQTRRVS